MFMGQRPDPTNSSAGIGSIAVACYGCTTVMASLEAVFWCEAVHFLARCLAGN